MISYPFACGFGKCDMCKKDNETVVTIIDVKFSLCLKCLSAMMSLISIETSKFIECLLKRYEKDNPNGQTPQMHS